jgi:uncharacterized protein (TIRG00374 family)
LRQITSLAGKKVIVNNILLLIGFIILGYFIATSGIIENYQVLASVDIPLLIFAVILSVGTIVTKIYRWKYLSSSYGQEITWRESSMVFMPSLFYGNITPGKVGDLYKAYYMKQRHSMNYLDGVSMLFYERFIELLILFLVAAAIVFVQFRGITVIALELILLILIILLFFYYRADKFVSIAQRVIVKVPFLNNEKEFDLHINKMPFTKILSVFIITLVSVVLEFIRLWIVTLAFGYFLNPILLSVFFSLSIIVGLVSQIPLGIGAMEGSLNVFITSMGVPATVSIAIVLVDRIISMYFALVLGFIFSKFSMDALNEVSE